MTFRVLGLDPAPFVHLYGLADDQLVAHRARRVLVDASPGAPDRVSLRDLPVGATALLVNHVHQPALSPVHASHANYIEEGAIAARSVEGRLPRALRSRLLSLRAFDADGIMLDADVADGGVAAALVERFLADARVDAVHAHFARRGCFAACTWRA